MLCQYYSLLISRRRRFKRLPRRCQVTIKKREMIFAADKVFGISITSPWSRQSGGTDVRRSAEGAGEGTGQESPAVLGAFGLVSSK